MFTNWKTGLAGLATAAVPIVNSAIPFLPPQWQLVLMGVFAGAGLLFGKDFNVTGGKVRQ